MRSAPTAQDETIFIGFDSQSINPAKYFASDMLFNLVGERRRNWH